MLTGFRENTFIRNMYVGDLLEAFLVSSVTSLLILRFSLSITGYPQLGGDSLHIAHMLWGGFLMMIAIVMLLAFLGNRVLWAGAIIGGIGFGVFLDELGKFITNDNNYLFEPTVALIYVIFLMLFFVFRYIDDHKKFSQKEYLMNSLRVLEEAVLSDLDKTEKRQFASLLKRSDENDQVTIQLKALLKNLEAIPTRPSALRNIFRTFSRYYTGIISWKYFTKIVIIFFLGKAAIDAIGVAIFLFTYYSDPASLFSSTPTPQIVVAWGQVISTIISSIFVVMGVIALKFSRHKAYFFFKQSLLVTIFLTQFFIFYREQFHALSGLVFNVLLLIGIEYMITEERKIRYDND